MSHELWKPESKDIFKQLDQPFKSAQKKTHIIHSWKLISRPREELLAGLNNKLNILALLKRDNIIFYQFIVPTKPQRNHFITIRS